jgi:hypothetical protein
MTPLCFQKARSSHAAGRDLVLEAAQTSYLSETLKVAATDDSAKYTWFKNPVAKVQAIYTPAGFLKDGEAATPDMEVVCIQPALLPAQRVSLRVCTHVRYRLSVNCSAHVLLDLVGALAGWSGA